MKRKISFFITASLLIGSIPVYSDDSIVSISEESSSFSSSSIDYGDHLTTDSVAESVESNKEEQSYSEFFDEPEVSVNNESETQNSENNTMDSTTSEINSIEDIMLDPFFPLDPSPNDIAGDNVLPGEITGPLQKNLYSKSSKINQEIIKKLNQGVFKRAKIVEDWRTYSMFPYKSLNGGTQNIPLGIVVHETANPNSSIYGEISYMDRNWKNAFVHAFVDKENIIEIHDPSYGAWGAGRIANQYFMHVELVEHVGNRTAFMQSVLNDAHYIASKLYQFGLTPSRSTKKKNDVSGTVWSHHEVSSYLGGTNHTDPTGYFNQFSYSFEEFYELIEYEFAQLDTTIPEIENTEIKSIDYSKQTFEVSIKVKSRTGIAKVMVPVWTENSQSDLKWLQAKKNKDETYSVKVNGKEYNKPENGVHVHAYATGNNGKQSSLNVGTVILDNSLPKIEDANVSDINYQEGSFKVRLKASSNTGVKKVEIPVWTSENQSDLQWMDANLEKDGYYTVKVNGKDFLKKTGPFQIHAYVRANNNQLSATNVGSVVLDDSNPEIISAKYENINHYTGSFDVVVQVEAKSGIKELKIPVWTKKDQSDLSWYYAKPDKKGVYRATIETKNHGFSKKTYQIHVYAESNANRFTTISLIELKLNENVVTVSHSIENIKNKDENYLMSATVNADAKVSNVKFAVWSATNNQSDLTWYDAKFNNNTKNWEYQLNISESPHRSLGHYIVHSYLFLPSGEVQSHNASGFEISAAQVNLLNRKVKEKEKIQLEIDSKSDIERVDIPIWSENDQSDLYWYKAKFVSDGKYEIQFDHNNHKLNDGKFKIHGYIYHKNGTRTEVNLGELTVSPIKMETEIQLKDTSGKESQYLLSLKLLGNQYVKGIEIPVWGENNGKNDIIWYQAKYNKKTDKWELEIPIKNHKEIGRYFIDAYARLTNDKLMYLGSDQIQISPVDIAASLDKSDIYKGEFDIKLDVKAKSKIIDVRVPIWSDKNQNNLYWYHAKQTSGNTYEVKFNYKNHNFKNGDYTVHAYVYLENGVVQAIPIANVFLNDKLSVDDSERAKFITNLSKDAQEISRKNNLYSSVMLAQASLESGYGTSKLSKEANNYFGVKFKKNEDEGKYGVYYIESLEYDSVKDKWIEVKSPFRKYKDKEQSLNDYANKLRNGVSWDPKYYSGTWLENAPTYKDATKSLQGKYATDPEYSQKLNSIIETWRLDQFD